MSAKTTRIAKHVYLRTQQRRLRHLRTIGARNLQLRDEREAIIINPLSSRTYFSLHRVGRPDRETDEVIYTSEVISGSLNPHWAAFDLQQFTSGTIGAFTLFVIKVWVAKEGQEFQLAIERLIDLRKLVYLGILPLKESPPYSANFLLFGMFEGCYSDTTSGMIAEAPAVQHYLSRYLPPHSVIGVPKTQVQPSYEKYILLRILNRQDTVRKNDTQAQSIKQEIGNFVESNTDIFSKKMELERLKNSITTLGQELVDQQQRLDKDREQLKQLRHHVNEKEKTLSTMKYSLAQDQLQLAASKNDFTSNVKKKLEEAQKKLEVRQNKMIGELATVFPIVARDTNRTTICDVLLPDELSEGNANHDQYSVAIGYMLQLVHLISKLQQVPLRFSYKLNGSRSYVKDEITCQQKFNPDWSKEFPLFVSKRNDKTLFQYAAQLVNREIIQLCQLFTVDLPKAQARRSTKMLKNLQHLVESFGKEKKDTVFTSTIRPLMISPRPGTIVSYDSTTSTPSSGPRTASNSFLSFSNIEESNSTNVSALTDLHEHPTMMIDSFTAPVYTMADDSVDSGGGAQDGGSEEVSTAVSNVSSSREELTSCSASEVDIDDSTVNPQQTPPAQELHVKLELLTTEFPSINGGSLLTPTTHTTGSHFSALTGLESVDSPTKPEQHT
ncbi:UV radiation resistance-associated protein-like [Dysidea avara]|uniref:UV radiation resistance-associated protein-like n=1 Tax=Dysidea avara TaxID=196820 RepID=UPI00332B1300